MLEVGLSWTWTPADPQMEQESRAGVTRGVRWIASAGSSKKMRQVTCKCSGVRTILVVTSDCFRIINKAAGTVLDLDYGNSGDGTQIQGFRHIKLNLNQTWTLERRSRSDQEIEALLRASPSISRSFQNYVSDDM